MSIVNDKDHDNQLSPDHGPTMDNMEQPDSDAEDAEGIGGPAPDAGVDEDAGAAKTDRKKFQLVERDKEQTTDEAITSVRALELDLIKRARAIKALNGFAWPQVESKNVGGMMIVKATNCDQNRMYFFSMMFGEVPELGRPHIDTFRGRFVDHCGVIVDDRYSMEPMIAAMAKAGLDGQSIDSVRKAFKEWAMKIQTNDLIGKFEKRLPVWDGVSRIEMRLIELFGAFDTELNREFGRYFWLSIYNRVMTPGCLAPIVLSLFGAQNAGKSRFSNEICREILNSKDASSVQLDLSSNSLDFLREITGNSVVANIGEMTGFTRGDLNKIKDFITRTSDKMHYKYEGHFEQLRQWISILDGNKYEGLQRDDSGNRRFYPMFLGQLPDKDGQPAWQDEFEVDFTAFSEIFWQCMVECRAWMAIHGEKGYNALVRATAKRVFEFSAKEMKSDRGTIRDDNLDVFLPMALKIANGISLNRTKNKGYWIGTGEIVVKVSIASRNRCDVKLTHLPHKMGKYGAESVMIDNTKGYIFRHCADRPAFLAFMKKMDDDDTEITPDAPSGDSDGGSSFDESGQF